MDTDQYVNQVWIKNAQGIIAQEYAAKIENMYKQPEGNCEPDEDQLKDFINLCKVSHKPEDKELAAKGT